MYQRSLKQFARKFLNRAGWDLRRFDPLHSDAFRLVRQLGLHQANVVLDVGANVGQFAEKLRGAGFRGRIVSFEASTNAYAILVEKAARDRNWIVAPQMALGDRNGEVVFNIAGNSASSSALPMLPAHFNADPRSRYVGSEAVAMRTLNSVAPEFTNSTDRVFLKLDVQGFEYQVLKGTDQLLANFVGVQCELSLVPLYQGEHLFQAMLREMETRGFEPWFLTPGFVDPESGRLLQLDVVFFRSEHRSTEMPTSEVSQAYS